jgi:hypothetical protein
MLFTFGYGYVASLVASEQFARKKAIAAAEAEGSPALDSVPPAQIEGAVEADGAGGESLAA